MYRVKDPKFYQSPLYSNFVPFLWWCSFAMLVVGLHMDCAIWFFAAFLCYCENVRLM